MHPHPVKQPHLTRKFPLTDKRGAPPACAALGCG